MPRKIAIAGAGVIGAAAAWNLARRGARVTVIDRGPPGGGASGQSFGWINASFSETPAYYRLRAAAVAEYTALAAQIPGLPLASPGGSLWWEDAGADFDAQRDHLATLGYGAREIGPAEFALLEPTLAAPGRCLHAPGEAAIDGPALAAMLLAGAAALGARILIGPEVTGILSRAGRATGLATSHGPVSADTTLIAAGVASETLLRAAGHALPMASKRGLIVHTQRLAPRLRHLILTPDIHFRQAPDGALIAGEVFSGDGPSGALISQDPAAVAQDLLARLAARLPGAGPLHAARIHLGVRPVPGDGLPAIGPLSTPGLYAATMHSGITLAPLAGRLIAAEILDGAPEPILAPFRPGRFETQ